MKKITKTVVVTGAESTGKSALCEWLSQHYNIPYIPEFAREYILSLNRPYQYNDVEAIARMQIQQFNNFKEQGHDLFLVDTWLIITKIWFEEVFKQVPGWLESAIREQHIDLFLVCNIDLPWIPDRVRENGGKKRIYLQSKYIEMLNHYGFPYEIVTGKKNIRFLNAVKYLEQYEIVKPNLL